MSDRSGRPGAGAVPGPEVPGDRRPGPETNLAAPAAEPARRSV
ncbi:hypothetical protein O7626_06225 [Micromonospora sp. WMMD1102]|nr:hypothetical protein [Micromonospora sp. WMMD1102]MDG4785532.1 hypothetical protein [Micromonospora sp. WMMD1102]